MTHLGPDALAELDLPDSLRIESVRARRWYPVPIPEAIYAQFEDLLSYPRGPRMPCLYLNGQSGSGKTTLMRRFHKQNPIYDNPSGEGIVVPVLSVEAPPAGDVSSFYDDCLTQVNAIFNFRSRPNEKKSQLMAHLRAVGLKVLLVDELHNISDGATNRQAHFLTILKYMTNQLDIALVCAGTDDGLSIIASDDQMDRRFTKVELPRFRMNEHFLSLLAGFEYRFPLRQPSNLVANRMANLLLGLSNGTMGGLRKVLVAAAVRCIKDGSERITTKILQAPTADVSDDVPDEDNVAAAG
jgi:hypothetical protein